MYWTVNNIGRRANTSLRPAKGRNCCAHCYNGLPLYPTLVLVNESEKKFLFADVMRLWNRRFVKSSLDIHFLPFRYVRRFQVAWYFMSIKLQFYRKYYLRHYLGIILTETVFFFCINLYLSI